MGTVLTNCHREDTDEGGQGRPSTENYLFKVLGDMYNPLEMHKMISVHIPHAVMTSSTLVETAL